MEKPVLAMFTPGLLTEFHTDASKNRLGAILRLNVSPIPVQIVESRGAPSSYAVAKKFHGLAW